MFGLTLHQASFIGFGTTLRAPTADGTAGQFLVTDGNKNLSFAGGDWFDQSVKSTASPSFVAVTLGNTGLKLRDTDASHLLSIVPGSNLTDNRTLTFATGDASRTLTLSADVTLNQSVATTSSVTFAAATINGLLKVSSTNYAGELIRTGLAADILQTVTVVRAVRTGQMADGFGAAQSYELRDDDNVDTAAGQIGFSRIGADNTTRLAIKTVNGGVFYDLLWGNHNGLSIFPNVSISGNLLVGSEGSGTFNPVITAMGGNSGSGTATVNLGSVATRNWHLKAFAASGTAALSYALNFAYVGTDAAVANVIHCTKTGDIACGHDSPAAKIHVRKITRQFQADYDASNYFTLTVGSTGGVTFDAVGSGALFTFSDVVKAAGYQSSDGTAGATADVAFAKVGGGTRTVTYKNGLYTGYTDS